MSPLFSSDQVSWVRFCRVFLVAAYVVGLVVVWLMMCLIGLLSGGPCAERYVHLIDGGLSSLGFSWEAFERMGRVAGVFRGVVEWCFLVLCGRMLCCSVFVIVIVVGAGCGVVVCVVIGRLWVVVVAYGCCLWLLSLVMFRCLLLLVPGGICVRWWRCRCLSVSFVS